MTPATSSGSLWQCVRDETLHDFFVWRLRPEIVDEAALDRDDVIVYTADAPAIASCIALVGADTVALSVSAREETRMTAPIRPVFISVAQYAPALTNGTMASRKVIEAAARLGADGAELRRDYWRDPDREIPEARDCAAALGVRLTYASHATLFNADATGDAQTHRDIETTAALDASQFRLFPGPLPADDDEAGWRRGTATIALALARGVTLALENYSGTPGGRVAEIVRVLDHYPDATLATNIDVGNYARHGEDVPAAIRAVGSRAISAHLKDQTANPADAPVPLGAGVLPLPEILAALDALPQPLLYCFEFGGGSDPEAAITRSIAYLRERSVRG